MVNGTPELDDLKLTPSQAVQLANAAQALAHVWPTVKLTRQHIAEVMRAAGFTRFRLGEVEFSCKDLARNPPVIDVKLPAAGQNPQG